MSSRRAPNVSAATKNNKRSALNARALKRQAPPAYKPDGEKRKERKVLDAGAAVEVRLEKLLNSPKVQVVAWRRPGIKAERLSGVTYFPDAGGYVPELERIVETHAAQVKGRPPYNVVFEFKGQFTTGSAEKKIGQAIEDLAHHCDVVKTVGALILDTPVLTDQQVIAFKTQGQLHSVVVMTAAEVRAGLLIPELVRVAKERRRLARRIGPKGGYTPTKYPSRCERALAFRVMQRTSVAAAKRHYGRVQLVR